MARGTQFCVSLANKPGELAKMAGALRRAKVNIQAISVADNADCCCVRMIASPAAAAKRALMRAKCGVCTQPVLVLKLPDLPGQLQKVAGKLARAKININYVYGSGAGGGKPSTVVLGVSDVAKAARLKLA